MADYTRMVAYIFEYENGKKGKNIGFAKVESRNGQCRISINLREIMRNRNNAFKAYTYTRENKKMIGIPIGEIQMRNGRGELKVVTPSKDIWGTGYSIDQMGGIIITYGDNGYMGTEWDDNPIDINYFVPYSGKDKERIVKGKTIHQEVTNQKPVEVNEKLKIWKDNNHEEKNNIISVVEEPRNEEVKESEIIEKTSYAPQGKCNIENRYRSREENWKDILKTYPQITPFENTELAECVRIEPKDLVHLRKEDWVLGNNSFLLHGYYTYRYLILGKRKDGDGFILGIPGVYYNKEYLMAKMFGFSDFMPAKKEERKDAKFGYWCRKV